MSDTKFTPGPWVRSSHGFQVCTLREHEKYGLCAWDCVCEIRREDREEQVATAALIAAAPDLYAALETRERLEIHQQECPYPDGRGCVTCATLAMEAVNLRIAALAKARGEVRP